MACLVTLILAPSAAAQQEPAPLIFSQEELDQLLAPIALYPDALLSQVLIAATYPLEAVQASQFARRNPGLRGEDLADALEDQPWDPSVKALVEFPSVLTMMEDELAWTQKLGDAFLAQQEQVMDTVQALRARAQEAGTLESNPQQRVIVQDQSIIIESTAPDVIYVPYYNPTVVYGRWWWPHRPPMAWTPPPSHRPRSHGDAIAFGVGVAVLGAMLHEARPNWRQRHFEINNRRRPAAPRDVWKHDPGHRLGAAYRDSATRNRYRPSSPVVGVNRDNYRGRVAPVQPQPMIQPPQRAPIAPQNFGARVRPAPQPIAPQRVAPPPTAPQRVAPPPMAPQRVAPQPVTPQRIAPPQAAPQRVAPPPAAPQQRAPDRAHTPMPPVRFNPVREQPHPLNPVGSAQTVQSQAERGRASREGSRFNRPVPSATATPGKAERGEPNNPQDRVRRH